MPSKADHARRQHVRVRLRRLPSRTQRMWGTETRFSPKVRRVHTRRRRQPRKRSLSAAWTAAPLASLPYPLVQIRQSESVRSL